MHAVCACSVCMGQVVHSSVWFTQCHMIISYTHMYIKTEQLFFHYVLDLTLAKVPYVLCTYVHIATSGLLNALNVFLMRF